MKNKCLVPKCSAEVKCRGLCYNHYHIVGRLVKLGRTTWEEQVKAGRVKGTGYQVGVTQWFLKGERS